MRFLSFLLMFLPSVSFGMKGLFSSDGSKEIVQQLCDDLSCTKREILNEVSRLRVAYVESDLLKKKRMDFERSCADRELAAIASGEEKAAVLLSEAKLKCDLLENESKFRRDDLEKEVIDLDSQLSHLRQVESKLSELYKISEDKDLVVACTLDDTKAIFRKSDFERDARFLSCGLYPFLFSENFKGIERADGSRELKDLDGDDLKMLAQGMKHAGYQVKNFKNLDESERKDFNGQLDLYCLYCKKNGRLNVLGFESDLSGVWSHVKEEEHGGDTYTYYTLRLNGYDFEFVAVPLVDDSEEFDFMMSTAVTQGHWFAVMGENPAHFVDRGLDLPMESVSYEDIVGRFLPKLNTFLSKAGFEGKFELPSDAQWQHMADQNVASDFTFDKSKYSDFGKDWSSGQPSPVKSEAVGRLGAHMFGGVWEWVGSPNSSGNVAIRGGSWDNGSGDVGPSAGDSCRSGYRNRSTGFRLLRTFPGPA